MNTSVIGSPLLPSFREIFQEFATVQTQTPTLIPSIPFPLDLSELSAVGDHQILASQISATVQTTQMSTIQTITAEQVVQRVKRNAKGRLPCSWIKCYKTFQKKQDFIKHYEIHLTNGFFNCTFCGKKFTQKTQLNTHKKQHFAARQTQSYQFVARPYKCPQKDCALTFIHKRRLDIHLKKAHL